MQENKQKEVNPDEVVNAAMQAKLGMLDAKEEFGSMLKKYDDHIKDLVTVINMMKNRILELESPKKEATE